MDRKLHLYATLEDVLNPTKIDISQSKEDEEFKEAGKYYLAECGKAIENIEKIVKDALGKAITPIILLFASVLFALVALSFTKNIVSSFMNGTFLALIVLLSIVALFETLYYCWWLFKQAINIIPNLRKEFTHKKEIDIENTTQQLP